MAAARPRLRWWRAAGAVIAASVSLLLLSQLFLPTIASSRLRTLLARNGTDVRVSVSAFPAVKLVAGYADDVVVHMGELHASGSADLGALLARTARVTHLSATVAHLRSHGLALQDVSLVKGEHELAASATVTRAALAAALPAGLSLAAVPAAAGGLQLDAQATVFGQTVRASALVEARGGRIVVTPNVPLLDLLAVTVFADPRVSVDSLQVVSHPGSYTFTAHGHLV